MNGVPPLEPPAAKLATSSSDEELEPPEHDAKLNARARAAAVKAIVANFFIVISLLR